MLITFYAKMFYQDVLTKRMPGFLKSLLCGHRYCMFVYVCLCVHPRGNEQLMA